MERSWSVKKPSDHQKQTMPCNCLHELINSNKFKAKLGAAFKLVKKNITCPSIFQHLCPSYVPDNLPLLFPVIQRASRRTASLLMAVLIFRYFPPFLCTREKWSQTDKMEGMRKSGGKKYKEKRESSLSLMRSVRAAREKEASSKAAVPQLVMLWLGQHAGSDGAAARQEQWQTDVLTALETVLILAYRSSKEEERQAEKGKQMEIGVGDRRLKFC